MSTDTIQAGSQFNQELITKARKGEIAILNDGSVEELNQILSEVWPKVGRANGTGKYYFRNCNMIRDWSSDDCCYHVESHSVKDFFMPDTKDTPQPRTYKVTRQQMKEIWDAIGAEYREQFLCMVHGRFGPFNTEAELLHEDVKALCAPAPKELLQKIFPEYFFIPEGEPVLVRRNMAILGWFIRVSDGNGSYYEEGRISGDSSNSGNMEIIPFTKNPPK